MCTVAVRPGNRTNIATYSITLTVSKIDHGWTF